MKNKSFYLGVLVGLIIGFVPPSVAYYSSSSQVADLTVSDLKAIIKSSVLNASDMKAIIKSAVGECYVKDPEFNMGWDLDVRC